MILDPKTSRETLNKYPKGEARTAARNLACTIGAAGLSFFENLGLVGTHLRYRTHSTDHDCMSCKAMFNSWAMLDDFRARKISELEQVSGLDIDTLTSRFMAGYTLKAPPNQSMKDVTAEYVRRMTASIRAVIGPQTTCATCATCALSRPCADPDARLCGTDNIIRSAGFYCSNAIRRKEDNND